jgi:hypothetical protein
MDRSAVRSTAFEPTKTGVSSTGSAVLHTTTDRHKTTRTDNTVGSSGLLVLGRDAPSRWELALYFLRKIKASTANLQRSSECAHASTKTATRIGE